MNKDKDSFWQKSYHSHHEHDKAPDQKKAETWKQFDTIDAWRHKRMYDNLLPLIKNYPFSKWLTIGDGRYGTDANYLLRNNITDRRNSTRFFGKKLPRIGMRMQRGQVKYTASSLPFSVKNTSTRSFNTVDSAMPA